MGEQDTALALLEEYKKLGTPDQLRKALYLVEAVADLLKRIESYRKPEPHLISEFEYYIKNHKSFIPAYVGRTIVIKGQKVLGVYDDDLEAIRNTIKEHELGTFLVHKVEEELEVQVLSRCG